MLDNLKARIKRMAEAWTENNDGKTLPSNMDASKHSGDNVSEQDLDTEIEMLEERLDLLKAKREGQDRHVHEWEPGQLPGAVRIRTCKTCGAWGKI
jgi:hypothetical protein